MCHKCRIHTCNEPVAADGLCWEHLEAQEEGRLDLGEDDERVLAAWAILSMTEDQGSIEEDEPRQ